MKWFFRVELVLCFLFLTHIASAQISQYDGQIKAEAQKIGWDWRMLAAIIYQESNFNPDLVNHKGAYGLMQLMPRTMKKYQIDYHSTVEEQLEAGGKVLLRLDQKLTEVVTDSTERVNFILASYNAGMSRVMNYRELAEKNGYDPNVWAENVERFSPKQTIAFVREVNKRYAHYKSIIE